MSSNSDELILRQQLLRVKGRLDEQIQNIHAIVSKVEVTADVNNKKMVTSLCLDSIERCDYVKSDFTQTLMMKKLFSFRLHKFSLLHVHKNIP